MNHDIDVKQFIKECDECVSWETLKDQGRHHFQQGRYGEAMACYQRAIKHARPTQGSKKILIQLHNNLAECALRRYDALTAQQETQTILEGEEEEEGAHKIEEIQIQKAFHRYLRSLELQKQIVTLEGKENDSIGRYLRRHWKALQPMKTRLTEILQRLQQYNIWEHVSKEMARSYESTTRHDYRRESLVGKGVLPDAFSGSQFLHSPDGIDENLLILFHGVGDTPDPFVTFAKTLSLPQTAILALKGPKKIPFVDTGFAWVDSFEPATFEPIPMNIHHKSRYQSVMSLRKLLDDLIARIVGCWNIRCERIHYLGFSQGGTVALDHALHAREGYWPGTCIAVNSILLPELMANDQNLLHHDTQIVMTFGDTDQILPQTLQKQTTEYIFGLHEGNILSSKPVTKSFSKDHQMVSSEEEIQFILSNIANKIKQRMVHLEERCEDDYTDKKRGDVKSAIQDAADRAARSGQHLAKIHVSPSDAYEFMNKNDNDG